MIKLKNISENNLILDDLGEQLLKPNETLNLEGYIKNQASNSSQIITLLSNGELLIINNDDEQITNISDAIDILKGYQEKLGHTKDNKLYVHSSSRPFGTDTMFLSEGDDTSNPSNVGGGEKFLFNHNIGDPLEKLYYIDFNFKENKTYIKEGTLKFKNTTCDEIHFDIVPQVTVTTQSSNTNYQSYGYLIIPSNGTGDLDIQPNDIRLVETPIVYDSGVRKPSFWNADYSNETHSFSNITPAPYGDGVYNMFSVEIILRCVIHTILLSSDKIILGTGDVAQITQGLRFKVTTKTIGIDHNWIATSLMTFQRERSY